MKLIIHVLLLAIFSTCYTQDNGYVAMSSEDYEDNTLITSLRDTGIAFILQRAIDAGKIANTNFTIDVINHVWNRTTEITWSYDFNLTVVNAQEDAINTGFIIRYFPENETNTVAAYLYSIAYGPGSAAAGPNSTYVPVPEDEYETPLIQALADFGKDHIADILISNRRIERGDYDIIRVNSVMRQPLSNGANYQFDINFAQEDGSNEVHGEFRQKYISATEDMSVMAYRFDIVDEAAATANTTTGDTSSTDTTTPADDATTTTEDAAATDATTGTDDGTAPEDATSTDTAATPEDTTATEDATSTETTPASDDAAADASANPDATATSEEAATPEDAAGTGDAAADGATADDGAAADDAAASA